MSNDLHGAVGAIGTPVEATDGDSPVDWREIDQDTIQLQDRPGLLEQIERQWRARGPAQEAADKSAAGRLASAPGGL